MRRLGVAFVAVAATLAVSGLAQARPATDGPRWLVQTNAACLDTTRERAAVVRRVSRVPSRTARGTLLRLLSGTSRTETRLLRRLGGVHPSRANAAAFARTVARFRARHSADARLITRLQRRWDARLLERQTRSDRIANLRLARLWDGLGASACAGYFRSLRS
jgi:hypothetical protein